MNYRNLFAVMGLLVSVAACSGEATDAGETRDEMAETATAEPDAMAEATPAETPGTAAATEAPAAEATPTEAVVGTLAAAREVPGGTYKASCSSVTLDGVVLSGTCRSRNGAQVESTLDLTDCPIGHNVMNDNGTLVCREG